MSWLSPLSLGRVCPNLATLSIWFWTNTCSKFGPIFENGLHVKFAFPALQWPHGALEKQIQCEVYFQKFSITNRISLLCPSGEFRQKNIYPGYFENCGRSTATGMPEDFWIRWGQSLNFTKNIGISFGSNKWLKWTTVISPIPMRSSAPEPRTKQSEVVEHTGRLAFIPIILWPLP